MTNLFRLPKNAGLIALGTVVAALLYANWWLLVTPVDTSPARAGGTGQALPVATEEGLEASDTIQTNMPETISRPVFLASRRPIPPKHEEVAEQPVAVAAPQPPEHFELRGVMHLDRYRAKALIRASTESPGTWVHIGESIKGWSVREISDDVAVVETNGQRYELRMPYRGLALDDRNQVSR